MTKDVVELITADHREVEKLFQHLQAGGGDRVAVLDRVGALLIAHSRAEEERVYPVVATDAPGEKDQMAHSEDEHAQAEHLIRRLQATDPQSKHFDTLVAELVEAVRHHVETEESEILPALRQAMDEERLRELGVKFQERREEALAVAERQAAERHGDDEPTKDELYRQAQEADIPGRSRMAKQELADALEAEG
ncbi:hemerythrin domain-containing protein [Streptomyces sp. NRRL S-350]|uniref:hemerythrin domain-containing protein n=1 Tax=Streptomyces sp. NRRL S-350 TaxID=1463902 RepID=UPI0004C1A18B|nr:hemerythrin domain-containing protein [Streptomyces sp. NRRL S-350]